jgi:hypothetical protein
MRQPFAQVVGDEQRVMRFAPCPDIRRRTESIPRFFSQMILPHARVISETAFRSSAKLGSCGPVNRAGAFILEN